MNTEKTPITNIKNKTRNITIDPAAIKETICLFTHKFNNLENGPIPEKPQKRLNRQSECPIIIKEIEFKF